MKRYRVRLVEEAQADLVDIYRYVAVHDSPVAAELLLDRLEGLCLTLADLPLRGHVPPELDRIGVGDFREIHFRSYRIVYEVAGSVVYVHCVLDGRRDLQSLLERRLLR